jgi:hypothetical protein
VGFSGHGRAISRAVASMASDEVRGMPVEELLKLDRSFGLELLGIDIYADEVRAAVAEGAEGASLGHAVDGARDAREQHRCGVAGAATVSLEGATSRLTSGAVGRLRGDARLGEQPEGCAVIWSDGGKVRLSRVITISAPNPSASAITLASASPSGKSASVSTSCAMRLKFSGAGPSTSSVTRSASWRTSPRTAEEGRLANGGSAPATRTPTACLRQYFPKGADLTRHTPADLAALAAPLNSRPRETLGWKSPTEALNDYLDHPGFDGDWLGGFLGR